MIRAPLPGASAGLFMGLLLIGTAQAGEVLSVDVGESGGRYAVEVEVRFDAPTARLRALITDYAHLDRINDAIRRSEILAVNGPRQHRVRTESWVCVGLFCKRIVQIQDVDVLPGGDVVATLLPEGSDFSYGRAQWQFLPEAGGTRMRFRSEIEPAFWVPPFIGPWLVKRALEAEALKSVASLERLAEE
ncbi:MAG: SRPBCC family protein [Gammaproteobacteria bacterium]|jgi:hypothetical protein|nr:SRPBCC family protein [Gammaproteobacteria bacterium]